MCGRFALTETVEHIVERFDVSNTEIQWHPKFNIAPTQQCPVVRIIEDSKVLSPMIWGLIPHWSKEKKSHYSMINARAETIMTKRTYKDCFNHRRCLIPSSGFFEWKKNENDKTPFFMSLKDQKIFAFAGLWDSWTGENGKEVLSFSIITTAANTKCSIIHDRMPVILNKEDESTWLDTSARDISELEKLLQPFSETKMQIWEVSKIVNSWKNDLPECIEAI